jgi:hypothetical protein
MIAVNGFNPFNSFLQPSKGNIHVSYQHPRSTFQGAGIPQRQIRAGF